MLYKRRRAKTRTLWTEQQENLLIKLADGRFTIPEISEKFFPRKTLIAVKNKLRKLRKRLNLYNEDHRLQKYLANERWIRLLHTEKGRDLKILDGFAGTGEGLIRYLPFCKTIYACELKGDRFERLVNRVSGYLGTEIVTRDKVGQFDMVHLKTSRKQVVCLKGDVEKVASFLYSMKLGDFDYIDLDPCGSCMFILPLAFKLITKGFLAVTYGQLQLARFKRGDVLTKECPWYSQDMDMIDTLIALIRWTIYEGLRTQNASQTKMVSLKDFACLSKWHSGIVRGLFEVNSSPALADSLNHFLLEKARITRDFLQAKLQLAN